MKIATALFCSVCVIVSSMAVATASSALNFYAYADEIPKNRLFDVSVCAQGDAPIKGGKLTLSFDSDVVEFRDVTSEMFDVKAKTQDGMITIVFISAEQIVPNDINEVFSIRFKSVSSGSFDMKFCSVECVDEGLRDVATHSTDTRIVVSKNRVYTAKSVSESADKTDNEVVDKPDEYITYGSISLPHKHGIDAKILAGISVAAVLALYILLVVYRSKKASSDS